MTNSESRQVSIYRAWLPSIVWMVIIVSISILPGSGIPKLNIPQVDKLVHFGIYFVLCILLLYGFKEQYRFQRLRFNMAFLAWSIASIWGTLMELIQYLFTESRHFEYLDILANIIGSFFGIGAFIIFLSIKKI